MIKVAYVVKVLKAYRIPLFSIMQKFEGNHSLFLFDAEPEPYEKELLESSPLSFEVIASLPIPKFPFVQPRFPRFLPMNLPARLHKFRPDVVFCPEYSIQTIFCCLYSGISGCKLVIWCSLTRDDERISFPGQQLIRHLLRKRADAFVCYSQAAIAYLESKSVPRQICFLVENCSDTEYFLRHYRKRDASAAHGLIRLLYVGAITEEKGVLELLESLKRSDVDQWQLTVAGDGPLRRRIENPASAQFDKRVVFLGSLNREQLATVYQASDVLIFPTHSDVWGHAIDEAMASGVCVLASDKAVAAAELINDGENGFVYKAADVQALGDKLNFLMKNRSLVLQAGAAAHETMLKHNEHFSANGILKAINYVVGQ